MPDLDIALIDDIRSASRQMVRELGFMEATLAATDYPPSAVHTILEIGLRGPMTAMQLADILHLEKSSVSRMVHKLMEAGEVKDTTDSSDSRSKPLSLTAKGKRTLAALHDFGRRRVMAALQRLSKSEQRTVREGLRLYAAALTADHSRSASLEGPLQPATD
jgi:DNA-binding MarR family transcriptional regulator